MIPDESAAGPDLKGLDPQSRQLILDTVSQIKKRLLPKETIFEFDKEEIFPEETIRVFFDAASKTASKA